MSVGAHRNRPRVDSTHSFYMWLRGVSDETAWRQNSSREAFEDILESRVKWALTAKDALKYWAASDGALRAVSGSYNCNSSSQLHQATGGALAPIDDR